MPPSFVFHIIPVAWLPDDHSLRNATDAINDHMKGSAAIELVVERDEENAVKDPEFMKRLDEFNRFSEGTSYNRISVGKSSSIVDVVKEINQVLNEDREEFYRVPLDRGMIAQELLLFENGGTDDLENLVNTPFSKSRVTLKTTWVDANQYTGLLLKLERKIEELFGQEKSYVVTGLIPIMVKTITFLMEGMLISYLIAGVVITLLMIFLLADFRLGLWSMIPNFLPVLTRVGCDGNARSALGRDVDSCRQHSNWTCCRRYRALHAQLPVGINTFIRMYRWLWKKH